MATDTLLGDSPLLRKLSQELSDAQFRAFGLHRRLMNSSLPPLAEWERQSLHHAEREIARLSALVGAEDRRCRGWREGS